MLKKLLGRSALGAGLADQHAVELGCQYAVPGDDVQLIPLGVRLASLFPGLLVAVVSNVSEW